MIDLSIMDEIYENVELLIFDKDGTLFQLYPYCSKMVYQRTDAIVNVMHENDKAFRDWLIDTMGVNLEEKKIYPEGPIGVYSKYYAQDMLYDKINKKGHMVSPEMLREAFNEADGNINKRKYLNDALEPVDGMIEFIREVEDRCKCAVYSNDMTQRIKDSLEIFGIGDSFNYVLGGDLMDKHKPDPEGILTIMDRLGVGPGNTALFGDSNLDVESGRRAECRYVFGVVSDISDMEYLKSNTDVSVTNFNQITVI